ncbi:MAG: antitoxin [Acidobacteria bacterium]|nr:antitoxin [Acidobacteriota bacterium]
MDKSRKIGRREALNVGEEVGGSPRTEVSRQPLATPQAKLRAVRKAVEYSFPTADIQQMLAEIERGRQR